jgi:hypothetical protein
MDGIALDLGLPAVALAACVALGAVVVAIGAAPEPLLITSLVALLLTPLAWRAVTRTFDPFEPIVFFVLIWALMFVIRPLVILGTGDTVLRGQYDISAGVVGALALGTIGALAFLLAYGAALHIRRRGMRRVSKPPRLPSRSPTVITVAVGGLALLSQLGRSLGGSTAYLYFAPLLLIPAGLLLSLGALPDWRLGRPVGIALLAAMVVNYTTIGQRAFVLLPVTALVVVIYMSRDRRPSFVSVLVWGAVGWFAVGSVVELFRDTGPIGGRILSPAQAWDRFSAGPTTEMFPALALQVSSEGSYWAQHHGYLAYASAAQSVPRIAWPGKPTSPQELLYSRLFPEEYASTKAGTGFTLLGDFYYDSGVVGVILGMGGLGALSGALWASVLARRRSPWTVIFYAPAFTFYLILLRGNIPLVLSLAGFVYGPLAIAYLTARHSKRSWRLHPVP